MPDIPYQDSCRSHIKVVFAPGCYGHYLTQCIYKFSELGQHESDLDLSARGDSHSIRNSPVFGNQIYCEHIDAYRANTSDHVVVVVPHQEHALDYFIASYEKAHRGDWNLWMQRHLGEAEAIEALKLWSAYPTLDQVPNWVQREFMSLNIEAWLASGYDPMAYRSLHCSFFVDAEMLFSPLSHWFGDMLDSIGLQQQRSNEDIDLWHSGFVSQQRFHNIQNHCNQWCGSVLSNIESSLKMHNVAQEAYIQWWFRRAGLAIQCHDLDTLPTSSMEMKKLLYEAS